MPKRRADTAQARQPASYPSKQDSTQEYGQLVKMLGGNWATVLCCDGVERRCHIRGTLQRFKKSSTRLEAGDLVLIVKRDEDSKTGDILLRYPPDVARAMKKRGEVVLPTPDKAAAEAECGIEFEDEDTTDPVKFEDI